MNKSTDRIYSKKTPAVGDFHFGKRTARVFDDMLIRSVPFYGEIQGMIQDMARDFAVAGTNVYDLGCSTGTTLVLLDKALPTSVRLVGVDNSEDMLQKASEKFEKARLRREIQLDCADLDGPLTLENTSVVIMNLTLQFIRPLRREQVVRKIAQGLNEKGCFILIEKVLSQDPAVNRNFIKYYYDFKQRNGYSALEISQKREALENVLIPYRTEENQDLLLRCGFASCDIFFKWYNFCGYIARKGALWEVNS